MSPSRWLEAALSWLLCGPWVAEDPADRAIRESPRYWTEPEFHEED